MSEIEKRIESLERVNRRWRRMTGIFAALLLISLTVSAKPPASIPEVLKAKRIEVLTPDGKQGIVLNADSNGSAIVLTAPGKDYKRRIIMSAHREGVNLMLMKHAEAPLFVASVDDNGSLLSLFDAREPSQNPGGIVLKSASPADDYPGVTMINLKKGGAIKEDIQAGLLILESQKAASLVLGGDDGKLVNIRVNQKDGKVGFFNENNKAVFTMP
ncbi:MAG: hypothetical protein GY845_16650 [Planctomycetes bacterium]|nr:hypothetical protein [Planctomycetota bacterium]